MTKGQAGIFSFFSVLLSLILSTIPLLLLSKSNHISSYLSKKYDTQASILLLQQLATKIVDDTQALGVRLLPRIHSQGIVTLTNNQLKLLSQTPELLPDRISDAVSWVSTEASLSMRVSNITNSNYQACFIFTPSANLPREITSFLALTRDGIYEVAETSKHFTGNTDCLTLSLAASESIIADNSSNFSSLGTSVLIPIINIHTIYRDTQGTLRIVSTQNDSIIENQPLRSNVLPMRYSFSSSNIGLPVFNVSIESSEILAARSIFQIPFRYIPNQTLETIGNV
jgi:hypothetical protein